MLLVSLILLSVFLIVVIWVFSSKAKVEPLTHPVSHVVITRMKGGRISDILSALDGSDAVLYYTTDDDVAVSDVLLDSNRSGHLAVFLSDGRIRKDVLLISHTPWVKLLFMSLDEVGWEERLYAILAKRVHHLLMKYPDRNVIVEDPIVTIFRDMDYRMRYPLIDWIPGNLKRSSSIPPLIVQTWVESQTNISYLRHCQLRIQDLNPGYHYVLFNDFSMRRFIRRHYPEHYSKVYDMIEPGAYRSDLFRLLFLYKYGGVYTDISLYFQVGFDDLIDRPGISFVAPIDNQSGHLCLFNAFMMVSPQHPVIMENIRLILHHVESRVTPREVSSPEPCLYLTGPCSLGKAFLTIYRRSETIIQEDDAYESVRLLKHVHLSQRIETIQDHQEIATTRHRSQHALLSFQMKEEIGKAHYSEYCRENRWLIMDPSTFLSSM